MSSKINSPDTKTTIVACVFDGGVVLGADTRVTTGLYVSNRASEKIAQLYDNVYVCRSGSAADTQIVSDYVNYYAEQHAISIGELPNVKTIAHLAKMINYQNPHLVSALIVAGWDPQQGGQVYSVNIGGTVVPQSWMVEGSGSTYIWGACDAMYKEEMDRKAAEEFVSTAVFLAIARDGGSGGMCRMVTITSEGAERKLFSPKDIPLFPGDLPLPSGDTVMVD